MLLIGSSIAALVVATPALAQCSPDPTVNSGITTCRGDDTDGLTIAGDNSRVTVQAGASIRNVTGGAAVTSTGYYSTLTVAGTINGGAAAGVSILNGPYYPGGYNPDPYGGASPTYYNPPGYRFGRLDVQVNAGGSIVGSVAVRVDALMGATATGTVLNAGTLTGTSGVAIATFGSGTLQSVGNTASGLISGSIEGAISAVSNQGAIMAGDRSAIALSMSGPYSFLSVTNGSSYGGNDQQAATIANASASATIALPAGYITNTGTIRNAGSGAAILTTGVLNLSNGTAAVIASGGATAISSGGAVTITNLGTITGSVVSAAATGSSSIDNSRGTITGDVRLGAGDDLLRVAYADGKIGNVTGAVDGGAGTDTIIYGIAADATLGNGALPTNFERLGVAPSNRATVTLAADLSLPGGVLVEGSGGGTLINLATLTSQGQAIAPTYSGYNFTNIVNRGAITATLSIPFVAAVQTGGSVTNEGTITAIGGVGVIGQGYSGGSTFTNSGTITASGTGADVYGRFVNSGTIRSTAASGLRSSYGDAPSNNSGTIEGAITGVELTGGTLVNTGTIRGGQIGVVAANYAVVDNRAGGVIAGPTAITGPFYGGARISNGGRIDGNVDLRGYSGSESLFVDAGGSVNGTLRLGGGNDVLVTAFGGDGSRPLAGVSGGVDAGAGTDLLVYRVAATTATQIPAPLAGFEQVGFEVDQGATLTLRAGTIQAQPLFLAGHGAVDLTADFAVTNATAIDLSMETTAERLSGTDAPGELPPLSVTSRGTISLTAVRGGAFNYTPAIAVDLDGARFENAGTINVTGASNDPFDYYAPIGISGDEIVNSGTINLRNAAVGIVGERVVNTGTITGAAGSAATAVSADRLDNRGSIVVDGYAVRNSYQGEIVNTGLLESRTQAAIYLGQSGGSIANRAAGVVRGGRGVAIEGTGAVVNEGTISGNVVLGLTGFFNYGPSAYVAAGGTLNGDLVFGRGNDLLVLRGPSFGVTGRITDLGGYDTYGVSLTGSGTVAVDTLSAPAGFEGRLVEAAGTDTTVTVTSARTLGDITLTGSGTIVNRAAVNGVIDTGTNVAIGALTTNGTLGGFVNEATVNGKITGSIDRFTNNGIILGAAGQSSAVDLSGTAGTFANTGTIREGGPGDGAVGLEYRNLGDVSVSNSGEIGGNLRLTTYAYPFYYDDAPVGGSKTVVLTNSGSISARAAAVDAVGLALFGGEAAATLTLTNSGTLTASGQGAAAVSVQVERGEGATTIALTNSGTVSSTGSGRALFGGGMEFAAAISLTASNDSPPSSDPDAIVAGAVSARIVNAASGTIAATGEFDLAVRAVNVALDLDNQGAITGGSAGAIVSDGTGNNVVRNTGTIAGSIDLGGGSDRVENRGAITGDIRFGAGDDAYRHLSTATFGGVADGGEGTDIVTIEAAGSGGAVSGDRFVNFERLMQVGDGRAAYSGTFAVPTIELAGGTLAVLAGQTLETSSGVAVSGGDASVTVDNAGTIAGDVRLGGGTDRFVDRAGSRAGPVDGGGGIDTYEVALTGDRPGIGIRRSFERLAVTGAGTLTLTADQAWDAISLAGTGLDLRIAGFSIARIDGSDAAERLTLDGSVAAVALGGGTDALTLTGQTIAGRYDGGAGADRLTFGASGPVTLAGTAAGFETVTVAGNALTVTGTLGAAGEGLSFGDGAQALTVAAGGTLLGQVDLGGGDDRLAIAGAFAGTIDGGAGSDTLEVSGGSAAAPVAFSTVANVETFRMTGGYATVSGTAALGAVELSGGRMVGLAGSTLSGSTITVRQGATFGSAGVVNANLSVDGTLSPGASPGTMTVNGNVALASGSTSLFEITPTLSDKLIVSGTVTIANGATLQLVAAEAIRPGTSLDLIVANGGITGSFSTVTKPATLFGFVTQDASRIRLLGQFQNDAAFPGNVRAAIDYVNATISGGTASAAFLNALPQLVTSAGAANAAAFAQVSPEAYASARQLAVENGLLLANTSRGAGFASNRDTPGPFAFGQALGNWRGLGGNEAAGVARARSEGWGALGGIGWSAGDWAIGAFGGYLDNRQTLRRRGARTDANGAVGGIHARYAIDRISLAATVAYAGGDADTHRTAPGGTLTGRYGLHAWTGDLSASYRYALSEAWSLQPRLGATLVRATRGGLVETGSVFALSVERDRETAAFIDGGVGIGSADRSRPVRLDANLGARWQVAGRGSFATAALGGGGSTLVASGVERTRLLGIATLNLEATLSQGLTLFGSANAERGSGERNEAARGGVRVDF